MKLNTLVLHTKTIDLTFTLILLNEEPFGNFQPIYCIVTTSTIFSQRNRIIMFPSWFVFRSCLQRLIEYGESYLKREIPSDAEYPYLSLEFYLEMMLCTPSSSPWCEKEEIGVEISLLIGYGCFKGIDPSFDDATFAHVRFVIKTALSIVSFKQFLQQIRIFLQSWQMYFFSRDDLQDVVQKIQKEYLSNNFYIENIAHNIENCQPIELIASGVTYQFKFKKNSPRSAPYSTYISFDLSRLQAFNSYDIYDFDYFTSLLQYTKSSILTIEDIQNLIVFVERCLDTEGIHEANSTYYPTDQGFSFKLDESDVYPSLNDPDIMEGDVRIEIALAIHTNGDPDPSPVFYGIRSRVMLSELINFAKQLRFLISTADSDN